MHSTMNPEQSIKKGTIQAIFFVATPQTVIKLTPRETLIVSTRDILVSASRRPDESSLVSIWIIIIISVVKNRIRVFLLLEYLNFYICICIQARSLLRGRKTSNSVTTARWDSNKTTLIIFVLFTKQLQYQRMQLIKMKIW